MLPILSFMKAEQGIVASDKCGSPESEVVLNGGKKNWGWKVE